MPRLLLRTTDLLLRRMTLTANHPSRRIPIYFSLALLGAGLSVLLASYNFSTAASASGLTRSLFLPAGVIVGFATAGPALLAAEGARDKTGALERVLAGLPLRRRDIQLLTWGPVLFLVLVLCLLTYPPLVAIFLGAGFAFGNSLIYASSSMFLGLASASIAIVLIYQVFRGTRWKPVRTPLALITWLSILVAELFGTYYAVRSPGDPPFAWLLLPPLVIGSLGSVQLSLGFVLLCDVLGVVGVLALLLFAGEKYSGREYVAIRLAWRGRLARSRFIGELLYSLRDPSLAANFLSGLIFNWVVFLFVVQLDRHVLQSALPLILTVLSSAAALTARLPRALFPSRRPPQQLLGVGRSSWIRTQALVELVLFVVSALPILFLPVLDTASRVGLSIAIGAAMFGCSHLVGWVTVVALDNPLGQVLSTVLCFAVSVPIATLVVNLNQESLFLSLGMAAIVVAGCLAAGAAVEKVRWKFT